MKVFMFTGQMKTASTCLLRFGWLYSAPDDSTARTNKVRWYNNGDLHVTDDVNDSTKVK